MESRRRFAYFAQFLARGVSQASVMSSELKIITGMLGLHGRQSVPYSLVEQFREGRVLIRHPGVMLKYQFRRSCSTPESVLSYNTK